MNLGRAKLILIIAFAGLNLFLGYQLFWPDVGRLTRVAVTAEDLRLTEIRLNDYNYFLEAPFDRSVQTADFLTVSPSRLVQQAVVDQFIGTQADITYAENARYFRLEDKAALISPSGLLQIDYNEPGIFLTEESSNLEERELVGLVNQFLLDHELKPEGLSYDYLEKDNHERVTLFYYQVIDALPVFAGQLKVVIESDHVVAVELFWLRAIDRFPVREMEVISAVEALTYLVGALGPSIEPRVIDKVELGYYSEEYDAERWDIPPVWRIAMDGNQYYYINAFTGNMEKKNAVPR